MQFVLQRKQDPIPVEGLPERSRFLVSIRESLQSVLELLKDPPVSISALVVGFVSVPLNPLFAERAFAVGGIQSSSAFWFFGGVASIIGLLSIKKFVNAKALRLIWPSTAISILALAAAYFADSASLVIFCGALFILCVPIFSFLVHTKVLAGAKPKELGSKLAALTALIEAGIFLGMCVVAASEKGVILFGVIVLALFGRACAVKVLLHQAHCPKAISV